MTKITFIFLLFVNIVSSQQNDAADNIKSLPRLDAFINDFEDLLLFHQETILDTSVKSFFEHKNIGITVVCVESIGPYNDFYSYSLDLARVSNRGKILIVVSKNLRAIQIQNSDDVLDSLTNEETEIILENHILPEFKKDKYFKGLLNGIAEIKKEFN